LARLLQGKNFDNDNQSQQKLRMKIKVRRKW